MKLASCLCQYFRKNLTNCFHINYTHCIAVVTILLSEELAHVHTGVQSRAVPHCEFNGWWDWFIIFWVGWSVWEKPVMFSPSWWECQTLKNRGKWKDHLNQSWYFLELHDCKLNTNYHGSSLTKLRRYLLSMKPLFTIEISERNWFIKS